MATQPSGIYALSLHDALPIYVNNDGWPDLYFTSSRFGATNALYLNQKDGTFRDVAAEAGVAALNRPGEGVSRSEEHTSELQSPVHLVCRLLLEKKKENTQHAP